MKKLIFALGAIVALLLLFVVANYLYHIPKTQTLAIKTQQKPIPTPVPNPASTVVHVVCDNNLSGSGTIIFKNGGILTNYHVINGSTFCLVSIPDVITGRVSKIYKAKPFIVPGLSEKFDVAALAITNAWEDSTGKIWGDYSSSTIFPAFQTPQNCPEKPILGDSLRIYGYPVSTEDPRNSVVNLTITDGLVSSFTNDGYIFTSAKVDSGNSGGLAVDQKTGCRVGIPSAVLTGNYQNSGVIIPVSILTTFVEDALSKNFFAQVQDTTPTLDQSNQTTPPDHNLSPQQINTPITTIDCIGPDGKHFQTTQEECDAFNQAWATPIPTLDTSNSTLSSTNTPTLMPTPTDIPTQNTSTPTNIPTQTNVPTLTGTPTLTPTGIPTIPVGTGSAH